MALSRRAFGAALMSAPLATAVTSTSALAAGHATGRPALLDAQIGDIRVTAILDGIVPLGRGFFFGPNEAAIDTVLAEAGIAGDALPAPVSAYLVQSADRTVLIDAGMGGIEAFGPGFGRLSDGLAALGVAPEQIDAVILTHAHPDHLGGLIGGQGASFPNAELILTEVEAGFWKDDAIMAQAPADAQGLFQLARSVFDAYADRTTLLADGAEAVPGLSLILSPGHTPGHALVRIDGGDQQLLMIADTVHSTDLHTAMPDVGFGFDVDTALAAASRSRLFDMVSADKSLIAGSHIHFPGFGRVLRSGDAYRFAAATLS